MSPSSPNTGDKEHYSGEGSSCVFTYDYNPVTQELDIRFVYRGAYRYYGVPWTVVVDLESVPSKGEYFNSDIRPVYAYDRIG